MQYRVTCFAEEVLEGMGGRTKDAVAAVEEEAAYEGTGPRTNLAMAAFEACRSVCGSL